MAVTKNAEGTMTEAEGTSTPEAEIKTPEDASKVSLKEDKVEEKPLYTQKQHDDILQMAKSEIGRSVADLEAENTELKQTIVDRESDVVDSQEERERVQKELEDLTSGDPQKWEIVSKRKELATSEKKLRDATSELATEAKANEEMVASAKATNLEIAIWDIATEFKGGDPVRLKKLSVTTGVNTEAKLRELAETLWDKAEAKAPAKKAAGEKGEEEEKLNLDSGETHGSNELTEKERLDKRYPKTAQK